MRRNFMLVGFAVTSALLLVAPAQGYKGAIPEKGAVSPGTTVGAAGVFVPGGDDRYVAVGDYGDTQIARVKRDGGRLITSRETGTMSLPAVAEDGSGAGLSADGKTLVLAQPRVMFPQRPSAFWILDAQTLKTQDRVVFQGDYSFDAISPDGSTLYFIEHTDPQDPSRYQVRAFDVQAGKLLHDPVIDPDEPNEDMQGTPVTRAVSPDGRWAYTLYEGYDNGSFVHALDTKGSRAVCIDVDALSSFKTLRGFGLEADSDGSALTIADHGSPVAAIDPKTFAVTTPAQSSSDGNRLGWGLLLASAAALLAALGLAFGYRRRRSAAVEPDWAALAGADGGEPGAGEDRDATGRVDAADGPLEAEARVARAGERGQ
jgi:DNA-binding beta-propeller fold protein YncE